MFAYMKNVLGNLQAPTKICNFLFSCFNDMGSPLQVHFELVNSALHS